jgi:Holliday junction resolvase
MTGGPGPRCKGNRLERALMRLLRAHGFAAAEVPLSGAAGVRFSGDLDLAVSVPRHDLCVEVKARADGFRELYCWLNERDVLIVKADRQEPLVVVRLSLAAEIAKLDA